MAQAGKSRELTPLDVRVLEPDLLGAVALVLHGQDGARAAEPEPEARRFRPRRGEGRERR
jgi:hypothetical protein